MGNILDEKGFVFMGNDNKPYWCKMNGDQPWFFYWDGDGWVSLKAVLSIDIAISNKQRITDEEAEKYHTIHNSR